MSIESCLLLEVMDTDASNWNGLSFNTAKSGDFVDFWLRVYSRHGDVLTPLTSDGSMMRPKMNTDTWTHVALVHDFHLKKLSLYLDGHRFQSAE